MPCDCADFTMRTGWPTILPFPFRVLVETNTKVKETWASRAGVLRSRRNRNRSLAFLGFAVIAGTAVVAAVSVVLRRGRVLR